MRVLFLTHRLPYPPNRGDRIRAYHLIEELRTFADVTVLSLVHGAEEAGSAEALRARGVSVETARVARVRNLVRGTLALTGSRPLTPILLDSPAMPRLIADAVNRNQPDVVLAFCSGVGAYVMAPPLAHLPLVVDMVDVDSAKWEALGESARWPLRVVYRREAVRLRVLEAALMRRAVSTMVVSDRERELADAVAPGVDIAVVRNGVDLEYFRPRELPTPSARVVFCGVFNYAPNEDGAVWLVRDVWPRVRAAVPAAELDLVGMHPTPRVRALANGTSVHVTGAVPDVRPYLWGASAAAAPLAVARGVQNKVLEALAAGLPCVVTAPVMEGLPVQVRGGCLAGESADAFARALVDLLQLTPDARRARAARSEIDTLSWSSQLAPLRPILERAARSPSRRV